MCDACEEPKIEVAEKEADAGFGVWTYFWMVSFLLLAFCGGYYYMNQEQINEQIKKKRYGQQEEHDEDEEVPLPLGWEKVPSRSRPGEFSFTMASTSGSSPKIMKR